ncbi:FkbM family methyltransferase [Falsiroseomonas oryziterrae]|uniref:FkbM family methyltransferase n=1 Tax=Falsiroseomonas oryziterrae TaxID=2911368 RepID=UPI001EFF7BBB|nr:FkbM family methyltransferase [Roseomonas sp. NPKOSM-4]
MLGRLFGRRRGATHAALPRRLEEAIAYFAGRSNPHHYARSAYLGDHTALALLEGRLPIYLDTRGTDIAPHIMLFGIWEQNYTRLFQRLLRPGDTVLDLGAHLGVYTLLACAAVGPSGRVHAFEPNPRYAALLRRSLAVNGFTGFATAHNVAVGAAEGRTELFFDWEYAGGGYLATDSVPHPTGTEAAACRVVALDDLFADPAVTVDVVKMDIEGTETFALQGMRQLLGRSARVRVMFEFAPGILAGHGSSAAELIGLFSGLGFRFWEIAADSSLLPVAAEDLAEQRDGVVNLLASRGDPTAA